MRCRKVGEEHTATTSRAIVLLVGSCIALSTLEARAQAAPPRAVHLDYAAQKACPDEREFRDAVGARAHRPVFDDGARERLVVRFTVESGKYQGTAELLDAAGAATWSVSVGPIVRDCSAVADSLAFSTALKLAPRGPKQGPAIPP